MSNVRGNSELLLGAHVSAAGGPVKALERAEQCGCTAMQIFVKGNTRWDFPPLDEAEAAEFRRRAKHSPVRVTVAHSIYLVNLASANPLLWEKSIEDMVDELVRCELLGLRGLVVHPGAHGALTRDEGIERVATALDEILTRVGRIRCKILLETTAGQGTSLGARLEELHEIRRRVRARSQVGFCVDTCHVFAAGYELRTRDAYERFWAEFDRIVGRKHLHALHLNDSKGDVGAHLDRHAHIGQGKLGLEAFRLIMNDRRLLGIPMVIETPKGPDMQEDIANLQTLRSLRPSKGTQSRG
ncbi:MAG: deoxyribonuclease IV [Candidatus Hydrogenedentota bacterium]|nr:deoxyribonuclease IV [Candidatus Sumerlaea chitinivorans]RMH26389.1 MAG: deoxyribonuclease IV [Candidatus Hydrogenedentota bacterium]GIX44808.1 MAG: putative endonuclease 4 [Candidatus Sumerlaea sp.]